ncbi:M56 family metallopeptidase [Sphingomonas echinoides]|uniref:M56 family metallopeptidase n=1 Tax=Sphingomonas echinoides TaxID=59803 RepID=UPI002413AED1|nr:M56 family metallopeptidase [Sphingomonas echinoides]
MIGPVGASWAIEALIASSVLMIVVLVLREPVRRAFGANVAYALWALPVLRLVLPPLPAAWTAAAHVLMPQAAVVPLHFNADTVGLLLAEHSAQATSAAGSAWILPMIALVWLAGAGGFFVWHALSHRRFCNRMLSSVSQQIDLDGVRVIESDAASGPLAFGVVRRYVAFPRDFAARYEPEERDLALAHELGHHARGDLIANWIALGVLAVHWFNPVAWRAFRAFRADQEIANDARVLAGMNPMRRHTYACAIVKAAHPALYGTVAATCHLNTVDDLKRRLRMLTTRRTSRLRLAGGGALIAVLTLGGLGLTASGSAAAARVRSDVERATGVDIAALVPPSAPDTPQYPDAALPTVPPTPETPETPDVPGEVVAARPAIAAPETRPDQSWAAQPPQAPQAPHVPVPPPVWEGKGGTTVVTVDENGKRVVRHGKYVKLGRDGQSTLIQQDGTVVHLPAPPAIPAVPKVPEVRSMACGTRGDPRRMTLEEERGGRRQITVCTDRIAAAEARGAAAAARGAQLAMNGRLMEQRAYRQALDGLRTARARMLINRNVPTEARRSALDAMNTSIAELESNVARAR